MLILQRKMIRLQIRFYQCTITKTGMNIKRDFIYFARLDPTVGERDEQNQASSCYFK